MTLLFGVSVSRLTDFHVRAMLNLYFSSKSFYLSTFITLSRVIIIQYISSRARVQSL